MAEYLVLIYQNEAEAGAAFVPGSTLFEEFMMAHRDFREKYAANIRGGNALTPTSTATSIRANGADVTDGPFAETKEALGGYYLIEAAHLDEAIAIAKDVLARFGGVEVRPILTVG